MEAKVALERLQEGNRRFLDGTSVHEPTTKSIREALVSGQAPCAVILGCSDSRVPPELVFDQGLGDLFVIRVAGNLAAHSQIGSVEYAVEHLGIRLVVVLGHSGCGAIAAAVQEVREDDDVHPAHLQWIVDRIRPVVEKALVAFPDTPPAAFPAIVGEANVRDAVQRMVRESSVIARGVEESGVSVVGAEYDLETGVVRFFDGVAP